jgi:hypothetical protein
MGMFSPRTGAPSMISYLASVSLSLRAAEPAPVVSRRRISISMCFSFIRTCAAPRVSCRHAVHPHARRVPPVL